MPLPQLLSASPSPRFRSNKIRRLLVVLLLIPTLGWSQTPGLGLWSGATLSTRLSKNFVLETSAQLRFSDNISTLRAFLGEMGLTYRLGKHWEVSGFYRYAGRRRLDKETDTYYYRPYHRFYGELSADYKLVKHLKLAYRLRYQNQFKDDANGLVADKSYLRNKLEMSYSNASRFTPFVSADVFYGLGNEETPAGVDQIRWKAGVEVGLTRNQRLDLAAFTDQPIGQTERSGLVLGVTYKYKLDLRKK